MFKWRKAILLCGIFLAWSLPVKAGYSEGTVYVNSDNGYKVILEDDADLLTDAEEERLAIQMQGITEYGNVAFKTIAHNSSSAAEFSKNYFREQFDRDSGMVFLIDMENRKLWIFCNGAIYRTITKDYADTITDNVYTYASSGDFFHCSSKAFEQAQRLLEGYRIAQPMKYICNGLLAVISALLLNFGLAHMLSRAAKTKDKELLDHAVNNFFMTRPTVRFVDETKRYNPTSSGSSGGSHHSSGGSHHSSGGSHHSGGGGGGHSF